MLYLHYIFFKDLVLNKATEKVVGKGLCTIGGINNASLREQSYSSEAVSFV